VQLVKRKFGEERGLCTVLYCMLLGLVDGVGFWLVGLGWFGLGWVGLERGEGKGEDDGRG